MPRQMSFQVGRIWLADLHAFPSTHLIVLTLKVWSSQLTRWFHTLFSVYTLSLLSRNIVIGILYASPPTATAFLMGWILPCILSTESSSLNVHATAACMLSTFHSQFPVLPILPLKHSWKSSRDPWDSLSAEKKHEFIKLSELWPVQNQTALKVPGRNQLCVGKWGNLRSCNHTMHQQHKFKENPRCCYPGIPCSLFSALFAPLLKTFGNLLIFSPLAPDGKICRCACSSGSLSLQQLPASPEGRSSGYASSKKAFQNGHKFLWGNIWTSKEKTRARMTSSFSCRLAGRFPKPIAQPSLQAHPPRPLST